MSSTFQASPPGCIWPNGLESGVVRASIAADYGDPTPILSRVTDRTRLVFVSHVSYKTGAVLPLDDIAKEAERRASFLVGVDGAQAIGQFAVSPGELGVHFYAMPGQKWLLGPDGTGALFWFEKTSWIR